MAIDQKTLKRFLDNPAMFSSADMGLDDENGESLSPDESDGLAETPEISPESMLESSDASSGDLDQEENSDQDEEIASAPRAVDSDIIAKLKRLKAGNSLDDSSQSENEDVASDMEAPIDLRKKAMQKIKQKYLGQ